MQSLFTRILYCMNTHSLAIQTRKNSITKKKKNSPKAVYDLIFYRSALLIITGRRACKNPKTIYNITIIYELVRHSPADV